MIVSKVPKALILFAILALVGAALLAGCGGGGSSSTAETTAEEAPAEGSEETNEEAAGEEAVVAEGKAIFTSTCAGCHTLKAAGASGEVGPNLDELEPDEATVEHQVINGGGGMPSFGKEGVLTSKEIKAVAAFVSTEAGK